MMVYRNMIVPAEHAPLARLLAETVASNSGRNMWTAGLSPTGQLPASHYFSEGLIDDEFAALLEQPERLVSLCADSDPPVLVDMAAVEVLLEAADISEEPPNVAFARLGLQVLMKNEF
jgi:hypothetical protein